MAMGRRNVEQQGELWMPTTQSAAVAGACVLSEAERAVGRGRVRSVGRRTLRAVLCRQRGRPGIPPGVYFRMLLVGYFEGIGSQRGIAWRCSDSLSLRKFLGMASNEESPDHSSLSVIRKRLPQEVHDAVFDWVLTLAREKKTAERQDGRRRFAPRWKPTRR